REEAGDRVHARTVSRSRQRARALYRAHVRGGGAGICAVGHGGRKTAARNDRIRRPAGEGGAAAAARARLRLQLRPRGGREPEVKTKTLFSARVVLPPADL